MGIKGIESESTKPARTEESTIEIVRDNLYAINPVTEVCKSQEKRACINLKIIITIRISSRLSSILVSADAAVARGAYP